MHPKLSKDTANRLRGLAANSKENAFRDTINNLRKRMSTSECTIVYTLLEIHPLFAKRPHTDKYPKQPVTAAGVVRLCNVSLKHELAAQVARLNPEAEKLCELVQAFSAANKLVASGDVSEAITAYISIISEFGYSNWLLRKIVFLNSSDREKGSIASSFEAYFSTQRGKRLNPITMALYDMMDDTVSYWQMRKSFGSVFGKKKLSQTSEDIVKFFFYPHNAQDKLLSSTIQSFGLLSLADTLFIVCFYAFNSPIGKEFGITEFVETHLDKKLISAWKMAFDNIDSSQLIARDNEEPEQDDFRLYRRSCAWLEYGSVARNRVVYDYYSTLKLQELFRSPMSAAHELQKFFVVPFSMADLSHQSANTQIEQQIFDFKTSGIFTRSIALLHLAKLNQGFGDLSQSQLLVLLNQTRDIAVFLEPDAISALFSGYPHSRMAVYLEAILRHDSQPSNIGEHGVRRAIQDLVINEFNSSMVSLAEYFSLNGRHLVEHFVSTCTESFLIQLYQLYHQAKDVVEAKASLLEWYGKTFDEKVAVERAQTLRLDLKLQEIRGDFNENRIYVDPVRFGQWIEDKLFDDLREACRVSLVVPQTITSNEEIADPLKVRQDVSLRLASVLLRAFQEFCSNKFYGVDSYIGRRIRHGTLRGFMVSEVCALFEAKEFSDLRSVPAFKDATDSWLERYSAAVDDFGLERLHVRSKAKPHGAIVPEIASPEKRNIAQSGLRDFTEKYKADIGVSSLAKLLIDYSWLLIEKDLELLREYVDRLRADVGVIAASDLTALVDNAKHGTVRDFCLRLNSLTQTKFREARRWFAKPSSAVPSAPITLLFDAVVREIKEQEPSFKPKLVRSGDASVIFMGNRYHYVYDVLEILVANAAEHGLPDGDLVFDVTSVQNGSNMVIKLSLTSEISPDEVEHAKKQLQAAMEADVTNAMVEEGFSGIRKIRKLQQEIDEISGVRAEVSGCLVTVVATVTTAVG